MYSIGFLNFQKENYFLNQPSPLPFLNQNWMDFAHTETECLFIYIEDYDTFEYM